MQRGAIFLLLLLVLDAGLLVGVVWFRGDLDAYLQFRFYLIFGTLILMGVWGALGRPRQISYLAVAVFVFLLGAFIAAAFL